MRENRKLSEDKITDKRDLFTKTVDVFYSKITKEKIFLELFWKHSFMVSEEI